eukprot:TRINITY_DN7225_c0_g1_i3.p1 TRINITY_DN7225_c0_g1~~TRINITY_DN7225_c0_g1_i3.p1  ORF type:complete len:374 (+),score=33.36 TRINITY_DN7225_c0_g1_i3:313-1434(+)
MNHGLLVAYGGWQIFLCIESYEHPSWGQTTDHQSRILYPTVLLCPFMLNGFRLDVKNSTCTYNVLANGTRMSAELCSLDSVTMRFPDVHSTASFIQEVLCVRANNEASSSNYAIYGQYTFLDVGLALVRDRYPTSEPIAGMTAQASDKHYTTIGVSLRDQQQVAANDYINYINHDFIATAGNSYWGLIEKSQNVYMNGTTVSTYEALVSASASDPTSIKVSFAYGSFDVTSSYQYPYLDWVTLLGVLGGASSLAMATHLIAMLLWERVLMPLFRKLFNFFWTKKGRHSGYLSVKPSPKRSMYQPVNNAEDDDLSQHHDESRRAHHALHHQDTAGVHLEGEPPDPEGMLAGDSSEIDIDDSQTSLHLRSRYPLL